MTSPTTRRSLAALALALCTLLVVDGIARLGLYVLSQQRWLDYLPVHTTLTPKELTTIRARLPRHGTYFALSSTLGWTIQPNGKWSRYSASAQGLRGPRVYDTIPRRGNLRVAAFGDSFTHGDDVGDRETWTAQLEASDSTLQVLNFGVPAYGLDQAYLRYRQDGRALHPDIVLIGVYAEDVNRGLNVWRPYYVSDLEMPFAKPRFRLTDSLTLVPNPLAKGYAAFFRHPDSVLAAMGQNDYFYRTRERAGPLDFLATVRLVKLAARLWREHRDGAIKNGELHESSEAVRLAEATLDRFVSEIAQDGAVPIVVLIPDWMQIHQYQERGVRVAGVLANHLRKSGVRVVDLAPAFDSCRGECITQAVPRHYTAFGGRLVVRYLRHALADLLPLPSGTH